MAPAAAVADLEARVARLEGGGVARSAAWPRSRPQAAPAPPPCPLRDRQPCFGAGRQWPSRGPGARGASPAVAAGTGGAPIEASPAAAAIATEEHGPPAEEQPAAPAAPKGALSAAPEPPPAAADLSFGTVELWRHWGSLLEAVNRRDRALAGVLRDCRPVAADADLSHRRAPPTTSTSRSSTTGAASPLLTEAGGGGGRVTAGGRRRVRRGRAPPIRPGGTGEATRAVLDAFAGSRVTSTRLRDGADRPQRDGAA